jgi:hypothetical protein
MVSLDHIDQLGLGPLEIRQTTRGLVNNLLLDLPLTMAQCDDFGVATANHYRALRALLLYEPEGGVLSPEEVLKAGLRERILELDAALGSGRKLTELVRKYAPQYNLTFETIWDGLNFLESTEDTKA